MRVGTEGSFRVRCAGWFSSWLVFEMNTEDRRSNVSLPSGRGYAMGLHFDAGLSARWSGFLRCRVQGTLPPRTNCSTPVISVATVRPFLNHCLKLRDLFNSVYSHDFSKASGYALSSSCWRPAPSAANAASAASMPVLMAAWLPLMRDAFR